MMFVWQMLRYRIMEDSLTPHAPATMEGVGLDPFVYARSMEPSVTLADADLWNPCGMVPVVNKVLIALKSGHGRWSPEL